MSEELGVRSEELVAMLRKCEKWNYSVCKECKLLNDYECGTTLIRLAADEIERLNKERRPTPKIAGRTLGTFIDAAAIYMTKADLEGFGYETIEDIFDIYEWLRCAKKEEEA